MTGAVHHRRQADRPSRWYQLQSAELHIAVAGAVTLLVVVAITALAMTHRVGSNAATAVLTAALGYAWGAYTADRAADRRRH